MGRREVAPKGIVTMSRILVSTKDLPRDEWLKYRRLGLGGSDAGAIVGLNPYATPYTVWADKTGRLPDKEDTEAMRQGRDLEAYVAARFEETTGKRVRRRNAILQHPELDFVTANIDREVARESAGLECKTTSTMNLKRFKNGEFPDQYYTQCVHYLAVTGWDRWYLAVLILNQGFYVYTIERDEDEIAALMAAEKEFWETYVVPDVPPPVDGYRPTTEALAAVYQGEGGTIPVYESDALHNYIDLKRQIKLLEKEKERCEQALKEALGDAETGECGEHEIIWRSQTRSTFDNKKFTTDHPEMDLSGYFKTSRFRVFSVKELRK